MCVLVTISYVHNIHFVNFSRTHAPSDVRSEQLLAYFSVGVGYIFFLHGFDVENRNSITYAMTERNEDGEGEGGWCGVTK